MGVGIGGASLVDNLLFAQHARGAATPAHLEQIERVMAMGDEAASGLLPTAGNRFHLVDSTEQFADELITDIDDAQHHFNFTVYGAHPGAPDGPISDRVISAAERRANEGLPVTATLDEVGSGLLLGKRERREFIERMRDNHIDTIVRRLPRPWNNPLHEAWRSVDHRKSFEIDGRIEWHGGMNLVDAWAPWHDFMQRVEGPAAAQAGALLAGRWRDLGGEVTPERMEVLRRGLMSPVDDASFATRLLTDGTKHRRELSDTFIAGARAAEQRFILTDPYLSDPRAMDEVIATARRLGPSAELFVSPKVTTGGQAQDLFTDPLRRAWAWEFADAGGQVHSLPRFSHGKGWVMDDVAGIGSHNKDRSSIRFSHENLMATNDPVAVQQVLDGFDRQRTVASLATQDVVEGWRHLARARDVFNLQY
ncbi:MAG: cls [Thermoleophilia bacterium]|nr:cls [Thermoleophilia bacterium]